MRVEVSEDLLLRVKELERNGGQVPPAPESLRFDQRAFSYAASLRDTLLVKAELNTRYIGDLAQEKIMPHLTRDGLKRFAIETGRNMAVGATTRFAIKAAASHFVGLENAEAISAMSGGVVGAYLETARQIKAEALDHFGRKASLKEKFQLLPEVNKFKIATAALRGVGGGFIGAELAQSVMAPSVGPALNSAWENTRDFFGRAGAIYGHAFGMVGEFKDSLGRDIGNKVHYLATHNRFSVHPNVVHDVVPQHLAVMPAGHVRAEDYSMSRYQPMIQHEAVRPVSESLKSLSQNEAPRPVQIAFESHSSVGESIRLAHQEGLAESLQPHSDNLETARLVHQNATAVAHNASALANRIESIKFNSQNNLTRTHIAHLTLERAGLPPHHPAFEMPAPVEHSAPAIHLVPTGPVYLPEGSSPWSLMQHLLQQANPGQHVTDHQIKIATEQFCKINGFAVPEWGVPGRSLNQIIPGVDGTQLKVPDKVYLEIGKAA